MKRIVLIHWNLEEAQVRAGKLGDMEHTVEILTERDVRKLQHIRSHPPDLFLVDLTRIPSQGREVAAYFRRQKAARKVPILFLGGAEEHVERTRKLLPDASFGQWRSVKSATARALRNVPRLPAVPAAMAGYSGTPLPKKLGIRENSGVLLVNSPARFDRKLEPMPAGAVFIEDPRQANVAVLFVRSEAELVAGFRRLAKALPQKVAFWIAWPKQASGIQTDLKEGVIRDFGLAHGWVDYKVCAIDETWSGLCFARKKK